MFKESSILKFDDSFKLLKNFKVNNCSLIYNGKKDGFSNKIFHNKCDNIGPTLTIYETNDEILLGGYTSRIMEQ
jgi:hypothetical protein